MTYVFIKHRADEKYEVRFSTRRDSHYQRLLLSLRAYVPANSRTFDTESRTWLVGEGYKRELELWSDRMIEDINVTFNISCERHEAWASKVAESYQTLHLRPGAPHEVVKAVYHQLVKICRLAKGDSDEELNTLSEAYEFIMKNIGDVEGSHAH